MVRLRFAGVAALALALALSPAHAKKPGADLCGTPSYPTVGASAPAPSYVIYSLADMGGDPDFGSWVAQTIPEVIEPGTWKGAASLRHYPPKNILVVYHTPAVQTKVAGFLADLKKSMSHGKAARPAAGKAAARGRAVVPADYREPDLLKSSPPGLMQSPSYVAPAPARTPKHLFHFFIRYEGEGIIDDSVVKFMKIQYAQDKKKEQAQGEAIGAPKDAESEVGKKDKKDKEADKLPPASDDKPAVLPPPTKVKTDKQEGKKDKEDEKGEEK